MKKAVLIAFEWTMIICALMLAVIFFVWSAYLTARPQMKDGHTYHQEIIYAG